MDITLVYESVLKKKQKNNKKKKTRKKKRHLNNNKINQRFSNLVVDDCSRGWPEGSLFNSYYTEVLEEGATPFPGLLHFTLVAYLIILSVKLGSIKYHFFSLLYDSTWDWTLVFRSIGDRLISLVGRVFANGPGDVGSSPGRVIVKTFKMVLYSALLNT